MRFGICDMDLCTLQCRFVFRRLRETHARIHETSWIQICTAEYTTRLVLLADPAEPPRLAPVPLVLGLLLVPLQSEMSIEIKILVMNINTIVININSEMNINIKTISIYDLKFLQPLQERLLDRPRCRRCSVERGVCRRELVQVLRQRHRFVLAHLWK